MLLLSFMLCFIILLLLLLGSPSAGSRLSLTHIVVSFFLVAVVLLQGKWFFFLIEVFLQACCECFICSLSILFPCIWFGVIGCYYLLNIGDVLNDLFGLLLLVAEKNGVFFKK